VREEFLELSEEAAALQEDYVPKRNHFTSSLQEKFRGLARRRDEKWVTKTKGELAFAGSPKVLKSIA
jgi:hypothetical protein